MQEDVRVAAARNNAEWCDIVCGSHGLPGRTDADAWSVPRRSPQWYPDAVTLRPGVDAEALLARLDAGPGASVKDSFADLDLSGYGFRVLFDAQWIQRQPAPPPADAPLDRVSTPDDLASWAAAHGGGTLFRPALLADPRVLVLARHDDRGVLTGGAVLSGDGRTASPTCSPAPAPPMTSGARCAPRCPTRRWSATKPPRICHRHSQRASPPPARCASGRTASTPATGPAHGQLCWAIGTDPAITGEPPEERAAWPPQ
ncbi:hypothetical protein [Micromonospora parva]|uniref:hypothetical protein n=1 Tax=Micromonospora parva TaxID=1464048 RepID=UPI0033DF59F2